MCLANGDHTITKSKHPVPFINPEEDHYFHNEMCNCDFCYDMKVKLYAAMRHDKVQRQKYHRSNIEALLILDGIWDAADFDDLL